MDLVEDDVSVGEGLVEQQFLDQDAVGHVHDAALFIVEGLHTDVVAHCGSRLGAELL